MRYPLQLQVMCQNPVQGVLQKSKTNLSFRISSESKQVRQCNKWKMNKNIFKGNWYWVRILLGLEAQSWIHPVTTGKIRCRLASHSGMCNRSSRSQSRDHHVPYTLGISDGLSCRTRCLLITKTWRHVDAYTSQMSDITRLVSWIFPSIFLTRTSSTRKHFKRKGEGKTLSNDVTL